MGDHNFFVSSFLRILIGDYPINRSHYAEIYRKIVDDEIFTGDAINRINRRHYAEIYRKLVDDDFLVVADELKTKLGLTVEEIEGAVGPDFWAAADKAVDAKRLACFLREQTPPPSSPPQSSYREKIMGDDNSRKRKYAEICRKLIDDDLSNVARAVQVLTNLKDQEIQTLSP